MRMISEQLYCPFWRTLATDYTNYDIQYKCIFKHGAYIGGEVIIYFVLKQLLIFFVASLLILSRECTFNKKIYAGAMAEILKIGIVTNWNIYNDPDCCTAVDVIQATSSAKVSLKSHSS